MKPSFMTAAVLLGIFVLSTSALAQPFQLRKPGGGSSGGSGGSHFTFHFSVDMKELHPDLQKVRILCIVSKDKGTNVSNQIGRGFKDFNKSGNSIRATNQTISFNASSGKKPEEAKYWSCNTILYGPGGTGKPPAAEGAARTAPWAQYKNGAQHHLTSQGTL